MARIIMIVLLAPLLPRAGAEETDAELHLYFKGRQVFQNMCVPCHGRTGRGDGPWAEGMVDKPRNFRRGVFKFRSTPIGKLPTDDDLRRTIRTGVSNTAMPTFAGRLRDDEIDAVIVYLQHLSQRWDNPTNRVAAVPVPERPARSDPDRGQILFKATCAACHGAEGKGDGPAGGALRDIWGNPVAAADLSRPHHKSGDRPQDLYRTIALGLDGTPMVGFRDAYKPEEIWDLVAFIERLSAPPE